MTDPHILNLVLLLCEVAAAASLFAFLVVALVPGLRRRYLGKLFPFTVRVIHLVWWSSQVFYTWAFRRFSIKFTIPGLLLLFVFFFAFPYAAYSLFTLPPIPTTVGAGTAQRIAWPFAGA